MTDANNDLPQRLAAALRANVHARCWWVALSGGTDSAALLDLMAGWCADHQAPTLKALHIQHNLHPDAPAWTALCQRLCEQRDIELVVHSVTVESDGDGIESAARRARYAVFESVLGEGDVLFMAHHADDQIETVLHRLIRGSGPQGLAGIPASRRLGRGKLVRPLLDVPRSELEQWVHRRAIEAVQDPANADPRYARTHLRHQILPMIERVWPGYRQGVLRAATLQRQAADALLAMPLPHAQTALGEPALQLQQGMDEPALATLLHRWLLTLDLPSPAHSRLLEFSRQCLHAAADRSPVLVVGDVSLRRWRRLVVLTNTHTHTHTQMPSPSASLIVGENRDTRVGDFTWQPVESGWALPRGVSLNIRSRQSGERLTPLNGISRPFGQLCQERGVPPWWRDSLPLLCAGSTPVWAPVIGPLQGLSELPDARVGDAFQPEWHAPLPRSLPGLPIEWEEPY